jgi:hypothetical protein
VTRCAAAAAAFALAGTAAQAADCRLDGEDVIAFAQSQGFPSRAEPEGPLPAARCQASWPAVTVSAPAQAAGGCRIVFFEGARLAQGWRVKSSDLVGLPFRRGPQRGLEFSVTTQSPRGESANLSLRSLTLAGPRCADWRDAVTAGSGPAAPSSDPPATPPPSASDPAPDPEARREERRRS